MPVLLATTASSDHGHRSTVYQPVHKAAVAVASLPTSVGSGSASRLTHQVEELPAATPVDAVSGLFSVPLAQTTKPGVIPLVTTVEHTVHQIAGELSDEGLSVSSGSRLGRQLPP